MPNFTGSNVPQDPDGLKDLMDQQQKFFDQLQSMFPGNKYNTQAYGQKLNVQGINDLIDVGKLEQAVRSLQKYSDTLEDIYRVQHNLFVDSRHLQQQTIRAYQHENDELQKIIKNLSKKKELNAEEEKTLQTARKRKDQVQERIRLTRDEVHEQEHQYRVSSRINRELTIQAQRKARTLSDIDKERHRSFQRSLIGQIAQTGSMTWGTRKWAAAGVADAMEGVGTGEVSLGAGLAGALPMAAAGLLAELAGKFFSMAIDQFKRGFHEQWQRLITEGDIYKTAAPPGMGYYRYQGIIGRTAQPLGLSLEEQIGLQKTLVPLVGRNLLNTFAPAGNLGRAFGTDVTQTGQFLGFLQRFSTMGPNASAQDINKFAFAFSEGLGRSGMVGLQEEMMRGIEDLVGLAKQTSVTGASPSMILNMLAGLSSTRLPGLRGAEGARVIANMGQTIASGQNPLIRIMALRAASKIWPGVGVEEAVARLHAGIAMPNFSGMLANMIGKQIPFFMPKNNSGLMKLAFEAMGGPPNTPLNVIRELPNLLNGTNPRSAINFFGIGRGTLGHIHSAATLAFIAQLGANVPKKGGDAQQIFDRTLRQFISQNQSLSGSQRADLESLMGSKDKRDLVIDKLDKITSLTPGDQARIEQQTLLENIRDATTALVPIATSMLHALNIIATPVMQTLRKAGGVWSEFSDPYGSMKEDVLREKVRISKNEAQKYADEASNKIFAATGKSVNSSLIMAVMARENAFHPFRTNKISGATGLMQMLPSTAKGLVWSKDAEKLGIGPFNLASGDLENDPEFQTLLGSLYLAELLDKHKHDKNPVVGALKDYGGFGHKGGYTPGVINSILHDMTTTYANTAPPQTTGQRQSAQQNNRMTIDINHTATLQNERGDILNKAIHPMQINSGWEPTLKRGKATYTSPVNMNQYGSGN